MSTTFTFTDEIRHRHEDGTEHAHAGRDGFTIGNQVIAGHYGDDPTHSHSTLTLGSTEGSKNPTGRVVWSERLGDISEDDYRIGRT